MCENYYPQLFLEDCQYIVLQKEVTRHTEDLEISSDEENSDEENSDTVNSIE